MQPKDPPKSTFSVSLSNELVSQNILRWRDLCDGRKHMAVKLHFNRGTPVGTSTYVQKTVHRATAFSP